MAVAVGAAAPWRMARATVCRGRSCASTQLGLAGMATTTAILAHCWRSDRLVKLATLHTAAALFRCGYTDSIEAIGQSIANRTTSDGGDLATAIAHLCPTRRLPRSLSCTLYGCTPTPQRLRSHSLRTKPHRWRIFADCADLAAPHALSSLDPHP